METHLEEIKEQQKASWNKFSSGWKKWDDLMMEFLKPYGNSIIEKLHLSGNENALDIASGTGEPALTIAQLLKSGKITLTDLSEDMLTVAQENAAKKGITNSAIQTCDVCELPFDDNSFDTISCRFGFMFFPDMQLATREMYRVLKPGGRIAVSVWDTPDKNFWVTAIGGTINKNMQIPPPPPEAPGMFRCAPTGLIKNLFEQAGLKNVTESATSSQLNVRTADTYWEMMTDVAAPFVAALSKADDQMRTKIKSEVYDVLNTKFPDGNVVFEASALIISGEK